MCGVRDSGGRDGQYGRGGRGIGWSQIIINGVDVLDQTLNFTADEWNSLGWNGGALCSYWKSSVSVPCSLGSTCEYLVYIV